MMLDNMDLLDMECPYCEDSYGSDYDMDSQRLQRVWECKDGTTIPITEMSTRHIRNCIELIAKSIKRGKPWRIDYLAPFAEELEQREFFETMRNMSDEEFNNIIHKGKK